jgi:hypothetical protein
LKVGKLVLFSLIKEREAALPTIVAELAKVKKRLSNTDANLIKIIGRLRYHHGDFPAPTLLALGKLPDDPEHDAPWEAAARAALKTKKPTSEDAANEILTDIHRASIHKVFSKFGSLPPVPVDALDALDSDYMAARKADPGRVFQALSKFTKPLVAADVFAVVNAGCEAPETGGAGDKPGADDDDSEDAEDSEDDADDPVDAEHGEDDPLVVTLRGLRGFMDMLPRQFVGKVSGQIESADLNKMARFLTKLAEAIDRSTTTRD